MATIESGDFHYGRYPVSFETMDFPDLDKDYKEVYPGDIDLNPKSETHTKLRDYVVRKITASQSHMSQKYKGWKDIDNLMTGYIEHTDAELDVIAKDPNKPISIVIPALWATRDIFLTQFTQLFMDEPIFMFEGVEDIDMYGAALMSQKIALDVHKFNIGLTLHTMWSDMFTYGFGVVGTSWAKKYGAKIIREGGLWGLFPNKKVKANQIIYEGNKLENISPYAYFPDPNFPIEQLQEGEGVGFIRKRTRSNLMNDEKNNKDMYFNMRYLPWINGISQFGADYVGSEDVSTKGSNEGEMADACDVIPYYCYLVPEEWGLGKGKYPEKYLIEMVGDALIVRLQKLNLNHGEFPLAICAGNYNGKISLPVSEMDMGKGMQTTLNYFINSHITNIRKAINLGWIVDPMAINVNDLMNPSPAMIVRTHPSRWGRGVKDTIEQIKVNDFTKENVVNAQLMSNMLQEYLGAGAQLHGIQERKGSRVSSAEAQTTFQQAIGRILRQAWIVSAMAHQKIGEQFGAHTQQFMTEEVFLNTMGQFAKNIFDDFPHVGLRQKITKDDILVNYNMLVRDNSMTPQSSPGTQLEFFRLITQDPLLRSEFNIPKLFISIARNLGFKNVKEFVNSERVRMRTMSNAGIQEGAGRGNLRPIQAGSLAA